MVIGVDAVLSSWLKVALDVLLPVLPMAQRSAICGVSIVISDVFLLPLALNVLILLHLGDALGLRATCLGEDTRSHTVHRHISVSVAASILILTMSMHGLHIEVATIEAIC